MKRKLVLLLVMCFCAFCTFGCHARYYDRPVYRTNYHRPPPPPVHYRSNNSSHRYVGQPTMHYSDVRPRPSVHHRRPATLPPPPNMVHRPPHRNDGPPPHRGDMRQGPPPHQGGPVPHNQGRPFDGQRHR